MEATKLAKVLDRSLTRVWNARSRYLQSRLGRLASAIGSGGLVCVVLRSLFGLAEHRVQAMRAPPSPHRTPLYLSSGDHLPNLPYAGSVEPDFSVTENDSSGANRCTPLAQAGSADLVLSKGHSPLIADAGGRIPYTLAVVNTYYASGLDRDGDRIGDSDTYAMTIYGILGPRLYMSILYRGG